MIIRCEEKFLKANLTVTLELPFELSEEQAGDLKTFLSLHCLRAVDAIGISVDPLWPGKKPVSLKRELRFNNLKARIEVTGTVPKRAQVDLINDHLQSIIGAVQKIKLTRSDTGLTAYIVINLP